MISSQTNHSRYQGFEAETSLFGLDHLSFEPIPDVGTYQMPVSSFQAAAKKGKSMAIYRSATARFAPTRTSEATSLRLTGRPEGSTLFPLSNT